MINVLGIGLDYLMLERANVRGDVRKRQLDYAKNLNNLLLVIYSPKRLGLKKENWLDNLTISPSNSINKATFIIDGYKIARSICKHNKLDAISTEDPFITGVVGYLIKKRFKIPMNIQTHVDFCNNPYWLKQRWINRLFNFIGKLILKKADTIRVGTNYEKDKLVNTLRINRNKINVIPVNSDLTIFKAANGEKIRTKYLKDKFGKILLFSGRLVKQKDITTLLNAFQVILNNKPSTLLIIIGSGPEEEGLKNTARGLNIQDNVIFTGSVEHSQIPEFLAACDIYTISSIFEGTCIAMAEAMASKKPIVATKFAGAMDLIIDGKTGFKVNQGDYKAFAEKVLYLLNNSDISRKIGENAAERVEEVFSNNQNIDKVIRMWEETAKC